MRFEWDEAKRAANLAKHGLDFTSAVALFGGPVIRRDDRRRSYGEQRVLAIGEADRRVLVCVFTDRTAPDGSVARRIISLRPASREERRDYAELSRGAADHQGPGA